MVPNDGPPNDDGVRLDPNRIPADKKPKKDPPKELLAQLLHQPDSTNTSQG